MDVSTYHYMNHRVRVVVLRGAGRAFCAGIDIKESITANNLRNPADGMRAFLEKRPPPYTST